MVQVLRVLEHKDPPPHTHTLLHRAADLGSGGRGGGGEDTALGSREGGRGGGGLALTEGGGGTGSKGPGPSRRGVGGGKGRNGYW